MKSLFTLLALVGGTAAAQAQLLPIPGARNPDWTLTKTSPPHPYDSSDSLRYKSDRMPNKAADFPAPADHMPNAARKSISGIGNRRYYWDADRRLRYAWQVKPGSEAPDSTVTVHDDNSDIAYIFRRRKSSAPKPGIKFLRPEPIK
ncbi:hypothetical protein [Hymenobacter convexus]|uniref:hypothetical protein n=1 Tax=Hymenobacter sp. CA1UV-4 TaxID=3063782 RepID=UPI0027136656|nr:hypothetical protein [Hymenobacter sp. CA1UV-4]MDO7854734.1 hypothetical protein [Hymenobacter sp. CA1UV-4]